MSLLIYLLLVDFFLGAAFFLVEVAFFLGAAFFLVLAFFLGADFFLGAAFFLGADFFLGAAFFFGAAFFLATLTGAALAWAALRLFLASGESLYEAFTWTKVPFSSPDLRAAFMTCFLISFCSNDQQQGD